MTTLDRNAPVPLVAEPAQADERAARRSLRSQVARLEAELGALAVSLAPQPLPATAPVCGGPRLLGIDELEVLRDNLAERASAARRALDQRSQVQEDYRRLREEMLLNPARYRWVRVSNADVGEPGCGEWHVRPRWGLLGMLMNWWRVRISSGCP